MSKNRTCHIIVPFNGLMMGQLLLAGDDKLTRLFQQCTPARFIRIGNEGPFTEHAAVGGDVQFEAVDSGNGRCHDLRLFLPDKIAPRSSQSRHHVFIYHRRVSSAKRYGSFVCPV